MNLDPGIVCYQHCQGRLFAFSLPAACPLCRANLETEPLKIPPFRIPYPFVRASQSPCALVIKPTKGDFLHEYKSTHDLHIGVTDSEGRVFEYEQEGLHSDYTSSWSQCLAIPIISDSSNRLDPVWQEYWDFTLNTLAKDPAWCEDRYDETSFNCYSFVVEFLQRLAPPGLEVKTLSKTSLCSQLLLPYTIPAAKYISLYRSLLKEKVVPIQNS
ncbi:MKRN2 opposite strand protein [Palaemon carinicauda]|uniref:MKRN2 opposite strand protein n=1 Tax=Palaemon carinicauda TaxID=392227 RepID=UPI0035B6A22B